MPHVSDSRLFASSPHPGRRRVLGYLAASTVLAGGLPRAARAAGQDAATTPAPAAAAPAPAAVAPAPEAPRPFSYDILAQEMKARAAKPHVERTLANSPLTKLTYDDYQRIQFRRDHARWQGKEEMFRLEAFYLGWLYKTPVELYQVEDGKATKMAFRNEDFQFYNPISVKIPETGPLPGVAGFRLNTPLNRPDKFDEMVSFLGASYFRALGRGNVYGLSARGLSVNTAISGAEEFPEFTNFYLEKPAPAAETVTLYAALESPSLTGAYRFVMKPGAATTMEVTVQLFLRADIQQLGVAPLTSMYLFGGNDPGNFNDFRPEVHDSDGLMLDDGGDLRYWRPLNNPPQLATSYFSAENPRAFGLMQRDRNWNDYLDAQAFYNLRPSLKVEPLGDWGKGAVRLVEIPSQSEANDNIVAFWIPSAPAKAGDALTFAYRLSWGMLPLPPDQTLAHVQRTRTGHGGVAATKSKLDSRKFIVDFEGGLLGNLPSNADVKARLTVAKGKVEQQTLSKIEGTKTWRFVVDVSAPKGTIIELSAVIEGYGRTLSETWLYQWIKE
ncbi:glucan biosynthesis protein D [Defluviimonas sp. 20V17]|uniref:Glucans biosynthesis protein n=1 Tax=Allgaiera indica TaxID=765699 RepID=A0AAN5A0X0_9RHOB|nr:glucan biosynthesis protein [Allgaiera indica]KDB05624.1 glucan biosynthesis protein D [Defluviimonas sp. 20V17]GHE04369.1 glucans biosynthesis protein G [Allgaiera indica]SDX40637.1 glucans biosynthesis protein [Allgaiera indica]